MREHYVPDPPQELMIDYAWTVDKCALWADMGTGKTAATLSVIERRLRVCDATKVLVLAPHRVSLFLWPAELRKWDAFEDLTYTVLTGKTPADRTELFLHDDADIHLLNFEMFKWLVELGREKKHWPYNMIVLDESSRMRSPGAERFKAMRRVLQYTEFIIQLTGTPAPNGLTNLWGPQYLLDRGERLFNTQGKFRARWFTQDHNDKWVPRYDGVMDEITTRVTDTCLTIEAKDFHELSEPVVQAIEVPLNDFLMRQYRRLEDEMFLEFEDGGELEVFNAAAKTNKCRQYLNGFVFEDEKQIREIHDAKLQALDSLREEANGMPLLVVYSFVPDKDRILKHFPDAEALGKHPAQIDRWNEGKIPMLVVHPASAGHGLNLQYGSNITVWYGLTWDLEHYEQTNARLGPMRQKQAGLDRLSYVYHLLVPDTIDVDIAARLDGKCSVQQAVKQAMKRRER